MTDKTLHEKLADIGGCHDRFCLITGPRSGQVTNGGCNCVRASDKAFRALHYHWAEHKKDTARIAELEAQLAKARGVIAPFAKEAENFESDFYGDDIRPTLGNVGDGDCEPTLFTIGDLRRARAFMEGRKDG